jgi:hypothetical protein
MAECGTPEVREHLGSRLRESVSAYRRVLGVGYFALGR